jgi:hypothetical protein
VAFGLIQEAVDATTQLFRRKDNTGATVRERERRLGELEKLRSSGAVDEAEYADQVRRIKGET